MKHILLVTPDPEAAEMLSLQLELDGHTITHVLSLDEARIQLGATAHEVCIVDDSDHDKDTLHDLEDFARHAQRVTPHLVLLTREMPSKKQLTSLNDYVVVTKPYDLTTLAHLIGAIDRATAKNNKPRSRKS
jgi:DNA-binding response OmpR family regulator